MVVVLALGVGINGALFSAINATLLAPMPYADAASFALNGTTLVFTLGLGLIAGLLFGVGPALRLTRADLGAALKDGSKATRSSGGWKLGGRRWLVTAEIAIALVLLIGAGLMIGSLSRLLDIDTGFNDERLLVFQYSLPRGRTFDSRDQAGSAPVIVISESAERELFGDVDPVGEPFALTYGATADGTPAEVIGVVTDVLYGTRENGIMPEAYFLQRQEPEGDLQVMVRTRGEPFELLPEIRAVMASIDPDLAIYGITTATALANAQVNDTRVVMQLLAAFAGMALLLAAIGIWGVVSYSVVQRRRCGRAVRRHPSGRVGAGPASDAGGSRRDAAQRVR